MAIEQLGESLLAEAKKRTKKKERKGKIMAGAILGLTGANFLLKQNAAKRIDELNRSYSPIINQKTQQLKEGVQFWTEHQDLLDEENYSHEQWKDAYFVRARKQIQDQYKLETNNNTIEELNRITQEKIADDIKAYEEKLNAYSQFKNYKDTKEDVARYLEPVSRNLLKSKELIERNNTVGGKIMAAFGVDKYRGELDDIVSPESRLIKIAEGVDTRDKEALIKFLDDHAKSMTKLKSVTGGVDYDMTLDAKQLESFRTVTAPKKDTDIGKFTQAYFEANENDRLKLAQITTSLTTVDGEEFNTSLGGIYDLVSDTPREGQILSDQRQLNSDIDMVASIIKANNKVNGIDINDAVAVQEALNFIEEKNKFGLSVEKRRIREDLVSLSYSPITQGDLALIAQRKPSGLEDGEPFELSDLAENVTNQVIGQREEVTSDVNLKEVPTPPKVLMAKNISLDSDIINESPEFIRAEFQEILDTIPESDKENRELVISYMNNTLKRQQSSESDTSNRRVDGTIKSEIGFLGPKVNNVTGNTMTELSMGITLDDKKVLIPLMVPTLTEEEVSFLQNNDVEGNIDIVPQSIKDKAISHAKMRMQNNLNPFYQDGEEKANVFDIASPENLEAMNPGERNRYKKEVQRANEAQERLNDPEWLDTASQNQIERQRKFIEDSKEKIQKIIDEAGQSFYISLLTPESQRVQQQINVVESKLANPNISNKTKRDLEKQLSDLQTRLENL